MSSARSALGLICRRLSLLAFLALALTASCAPDKLVPITQVMVVVHSDLTPATQLTQVSVEVQDEAGTRTGDQRSFSVASRAGEPGLQQLPFSFSVVEASENPAARFRLVVTGWGPPGQDGTPTRLVRQTAIAGFQPGLTLRLVMYLGKVCLQSFCGESPSQTCYPSANAGTGAGQCGALVPQDALSPVKPGSESVGVDWPEFGAGAVTAVDGSTQGQLPDAAQSVDTGGRPDLGVEGGVVRDAAVEAGVARDAGAAAAVGADATAQAGAEAGVAQDAGSVRVCLEGITDYTKNGPFSFEAKVSGSVKLWVPGVPSGCKVPVIHLANGTGASCSTYQAILERLASHGFLATCYEDANTGAGSMGVMAFETALQMYPNLADHKLGSTGHNQGGQAAFTTLQLAEEKWGNSMTYAGLSMQPASGFGTQPTGGTWQEVYAKVKSPMFILSGTEDTLVSDGWIQQAYNALPSTNETYWWSAIGATHIPPPLMWAQQVSVPWFRWKLLGDKEACTAFKALPDGVTWQKKMSRNEKACQ